LLTLWLSLCILSSNSTHTNLTNQMAQTLQQLRDSVDLLIEQQGLTAPCSALIFTREDVYEIDENGDFFYLEESITNKVLVYQFFVFA
jgi:hypothetical protein